MFLCTKKMVFCKVVTKTRLHCTVRITKNRKSTQNKISKIGTNLQKLLQLPEFVKSGLELCKVNASIPILNMSAAGLSKQSSSAAYSGPKNMKMKVIQVNLCQKLLFLHQLTQNMTTDCSWNYHEKYKCRTCSANILRL